VFSLPDLRKIATVALHDGAVNGLALSPDGTIGASSSGDKVSRVWRVNSATFHRSISPDTPGASDSGLTDPEEIRTLSFSHDGRLVLSGSDGGTVRFWNTGSSEPNSSFQFHDWVAGARFTADDTKVVIFGGNHSAQLLDRSSHQLLARFGDMGAPIEAAQLYQNGGRLLTMSMNPDTANIPTDTPGKITEAWDLASGEKQFALRGHYISRSGFALSHDGKYFATVDWSDEWSLRNAANGEVVHKVAAEDGILWDASFSPDGHTVITVSERGIARLWSVPEGKPIAEFKAAGPLKFAVFSPDSSKVAALGGPGDSTTLYIWDLRKKTLLVQLERVLYFKSADAFSHDSSFFAVRLDSGEIAVLYLGSGEEVARLASDSLITYVAFMPGTSSLVAGDRFGHIDIWRLEWLNRELSSELVRRVCSEKLVGVARLISDMDVDIVPSLGSRRGEDVCQR
jgi:WD40 repeat protein